MKINFNSPDNLEIQKTLELFYNTTKVVISVFHESKKYYLQLFLDDFL